LCRDGDLIEVKRLSVAERDQALRVLDSVDVIAIDTPQIAGTVGAACVATANHSASGYGDVASAAPLA
jgi:hypothetical protein